MSERSSNSQGYSHPPVFCDANQNDRWKTEVDAWTKITKLSKKQQGLAVALSFPDGSAVRDKVFIELEISQLDADDGIEKVLSFLGLTQKERQLDIGVDFTKKDTLLDQVSTSLLKFSVKQTVILHEKDTIICVKTEQTTTADTLIVGSSVNEWSDVEWKRDRPGLQQARGRGGRGRGRAAGRSFTTDNWRGNPLDAQGIRTRCRICGSTYHYARSCPERRAQRAFVTGSTQETLEDVSVEDPIMSSSYNYQVIDVKIEGLIGKSLNHSILDSACTSTVCGEDWLKCYLESLDDEKLSKVKEFPSKMGFRFGDGKTLMSTN
ncbi:hypothetical protein Pcinc_006466 [Petrolisthes cinctipes]|uniref:CCHC-type domain-containing protein n=1 Tax=Petrolisthes cinctipes TaxID=88211 RepID=A0AAE1KYB5_PETCI|nr:hypothetical protein Pcinc_006466 [Petrolisthes cinctipes]